MKAATISTRPTGTLTQKIHSHEKELVSQPPSSGPSAAAPEITAPHTPKAAARALPRKVSLTVASVDGRMHAPPMPWRTRALISSSALPLRAAQVLPPMNRAIPMMKMFRRPNRSPSAAAVSSRAASTIAYRELIHCPSVRSRWRSSMMVGSETATMVPSITIIARPSESTPSAHQRREPCKCSGGSGAEFWTVVMTRTLVGHDLSSHPSKDGGLYVGYYGTSMRYMQVSNRALTRDVPTRFQLRRGGPLSWFYVESPELAAHW
ncbi:hypothetical protein GCM10023217_10800 [Gordonia alkaliphila]|uniref:Uncharacterized protein n=1 Tax=Gordonia alkaliphila TaxID=1053547 RepID=A0ABP8Z1I9_9ACTN